MLELDDRYVEYSVSTITTTLLERAKTGEEDAWSCVVYLYGPLVYKWCRKRGLSREATRDVAQNVFEVVARKLKDFRREDASNTFRGWLRAISDNKISDYWRDQYKCPDRVSVEDPHRSLEQVQFREEIDNGSDVQDSLDIFERVLQYGKARVNPKHWEVFWRVIVDEEDRHEIAASLEIKRANVDVIVSRVLAKLKETFGDVFEDRGSPFHEPRQESDGHQ
ncbi:MAG: nccH [Schlesneria sp.]|nr:nccH [Schlesneria sp.]